MSDETPGWWREIQERQSAGLVIGARVRIDLGECPARFWHTPTEQDREGTIVGDANVHPGCHGYKVKFDEPFGTGGWWFMAAELRLLDDAGGTGE